MSIPVFALSEKAQADLAQSRAEATTAFNNGIEKGGIWFKITLEQAQEMHRTRAARIYREGMIQVNPDSTIRINCSHCFKASNVARDVKTFRCHCSPREEQWVVKSRSINA